MKRKRNNLQRYRNMHITISDENFALLVERITAAATDVWTRRVDEEERYRTNKPAGICLQTSGNASHAPAEIWIKRLGANLHHVHVYPPLHQRGQMTAVEYNAAFQAFRERFGGLIQEYADTVLEEPGEVGIRDFVGETAAKAFEDFIGEYRRYRKTLGCPHNRDKWDRFTFLAYEMGAGKNLAASKLQELLLKDGLPEDYADKLSERWSIEMDAYRNLDRSRESAAR